MTRGAFVLPAAAMAAASIVFALAPVNLHARSRYRPVALIEAVCLESGASVQNIRAAAINHLDLRETDLLRTEAGSGGEHRADFSVPYHPNSPDSKVRLKGMLVISYLVEAPEIARSCSLSLEGETDHAGGRVEKFNKVMETFLANHKPTQSHRHPNASFANNSYGERGSLTHNGRHLSYEALVENAEASNERLTVTISFPPTL